MESQNCSEVVVVMVPFPAQGHLNQLLHLSHLISSYGLAVHYAGSSIHNHQVKLRLENKGSKTLNNIHFHDFQLQPQSSPPPEPEPNHSTLFPTHLEPLFDIPAHLRQPVSQLLQELSTKFRKVIVIFDSLVTSVVQDVKSIPNAESYVFFPVSAFTMFTNIWEMIPEKPFQLDSDVPTCIPSNEGCLTPKVFDYMIGQQKLLGFESGMLYNTSRVIEGKYMELLEKLSVSPDTKHFVVGPLNPVKMDIQNKDERHVCLEWLDRQEISSVIYISFGSTTTMTDEQVTELALGLERSEQKFIWVLRSADTTDFNTDGLKGKSQLPEGFENRVNHKGMVVRDWVPQLQILAHPSIGGFMSHCGWNSCMESISMGVPMVVWPMHSDQPRNALLVTEVLKVGSSVRDWTHRANIVTSTTIENVVRRLMASEEGKEMQKRAAELGDAVRASIAYEGVSNREMKSFISHITRSCSLSVKFSS